MQRSTARPMAIGLRWGFILVGLALLFGSLMGWGELFWEWRFRGITAASVAQYDLRPFIFASPIVQVWFARLVPLGWEITGMAGLVFFLKGSFRPRAGRLIIVGFVSMCVLALLLVVASGPTFIRPGAIPVASLQGFERLARVSFPPGTELVEARYEGGMEPSHAAKVTMPPALVKSFVMTTLPAVVHLGFEKPLPIQWSRTERPEMNVPWLAELPDWHPERAKRYLSAWATTAEGEPSVEVLADLDDHGKAVVYVVIRY